MTGGLRPLWIAPALSCFLLNIVVRISALRTPSFESANASELVELVHGCEEITVNVLMFVGVVSGLHALGSQSLQNLGEFARDVRGQGRFLDQSCEEHRKSLCQHVVLADEDVLSGPDHLRRLFRWLAVSPLIYLVAFSVYVGQCEWPPPSLGVMFGDVANMAHGSRSHRQTGVYEVFLWFGYSLTAVHLSTGALMGARVFHSACSSAIAAMVDELDNLGEQCGAGGSLGVVLSHHDKICEEMRCFWGHAEAGLAIAAAIAVCFSLSLSSGINLLIILAAPHAVSRSSSSDLQLYTPNVAAFFFGATLLLILLSYLASITDMSTSTKPHEKSIVSAMRRYVTHCLARDAEIKLGIENQSGEQPLSTAERNELLSAGNMVESRTAGVQLLGFLDMSMGLVTATLLRLFIYAPAGLKFLSTFLLHSSENGICQSCDGFVNSTLWNCSGCLTSDS